MVRWVVLNLVVWTRQKHSSRSYYCIDIGSVPIDLPKLLNVWAAFSAVATDAVVVYIAICFSTVVPLALSLGQCRRTCPPSENVRVIFSYTAFSLVFWSAKALHFLANLAWAVVLVYCPGFYWWWLQAGVAGGWLAGERWLAVLVGYWRNGVSKTAKIYQSRQLQLQATVKRFLFDLQWPSRSTYFD